MTTKTVKKNHEDGCAYGRPKGTYDTELAEVGPGTPCGEFLRRYWHPVGVSGDVTSTPRKVRVLGEDLILFRDKRGRPGLLAHRCAHRGASLYFGKVDESGIRCCYHGWQFDVEGRCIDQPCEPGRGARKDRIHQPWYPVEELYGLVFAYMGPPEKRPLLPRWDVFEDIGSNEKVLAGGPTGYGAGGDHTVKIVPWNWMQNWENTMDPFHLPVLHSTFSGVHFAPDMARMPNVQFEYTDLGVRYSAVFTLSDGREMDRVSPALFPNIRSVPEVSLDPGPASSMLWLVPVDDLNHCIFWAMRAPIDFNGILTRPSSMTPPKLWSEMTEEEYQLFPGDWEAQSSQGRITLHSDEHLATSDKGIAMLRRLIKQQIKIVREGGNPIGTTFPPANPVRSTGAGNFLRESAP